MILEQPFLTVTPSVDGDVLSALASSPEGLALTLPDMQRMRPERSYGGIRLAAERLVAQGVVTEGRVGKTRVFELNRDHLASDAILSLADARRRFLDRLREDVAHRPMIVYACLFGSAARKDMHADSDIDLLFVAGQGDITDDVQEVAAHAHAMTGNDVRPIVFEEHELESTPLLKNVLRDEIPLTSNGSYLRHKISAARAGG